MPSVPNLRHPTELASTHPDDQPCSSATAVKLVAHLQLTEGEAQALLLAPEVTEEEILDAQKVDPHALAHAFVAPAVGALLTDPKLELSEDEKTNIRERAPRVRTTSSACDKLQVVHDFAISAIKVDAGVLQVVLNNAVPQIKARARANPAVRTTYSSFLAYQHNRFPGRKGHSGAQKPAGAGQTLSGGSQPQKSVEKT